MAKKVQCRLCGGTGKLVLMRSWFHSDGYRREVCHRCGGTKEQSKHHTGWRDWEISQAKLREKAGIRG